MVERIPGHVGLSPQLAIAPGEQLQVVLGRVRAIPLDEVVVLDSRLAHRRPDLHGPEELPQVLVDPVEAAGDHLLRVVLEVVEDRDVGIAGELGALLAEEPVEP